MRLLPLTQWTLHGENLPQRLADEKIKSAFSLPGADELSAFADLIGGANEKEQSKETGVPFIAGRPFDEDITGSVILRRELDFDAMEGDYALLAFEHIAGCGAVCLGGRELARFGDARAEALRHAYDLTGMACSLCVDVTPFLMQGKKETLEIRFDDARPAGVCDAAFLRVCTYAHLSRVSIQPDALRRTMALRARITAHQAGRYVLRAQVIPAEPGTELPDARETDVTLAAGDEKGLQMTMEVSAPAFVPGKACAAPAMKIQLYARNEKTRGDGFLCDDALLMCGYGSSAPRAWMPVSGDQAGKLCGQLQSLGITAIALDKPATDGLYRTLCRAGVGAIGHVSEEIRPLFTRYPCLTLSDFPPARDDVSPAAAAWQMTGSVSFPRAIDETLTPEEMIDEACGRRLNLDSDGVRDALSWLRAVQIRLRAEAVRQGRYQGAICSEEDMENGDVQEALRTAFAPLHLSALPLSGAWWTGTRFSASLEAFVPRDVLQRGPVDALAVLENEDGKELARVYVPCSRGGYLGVIEYPLGDQPCVLTLSCVISRAGDVLEQSSFPVYVGDRGPLEAAF